LARALLKTKAGLAAIVCVLVGVVLLWIAKYSEDHWQSGLPSQVPWEGLGGAVLSSAFILGVFELWVRSEASTERDQATREAIQAELPGLRSSVLEALQVGNLAQHLPLSEDELDRTIVGALTRRVNDPQLAAEVFDQVRSQIAEASEFWYDMRVVIGFEPFTTASGEASERLFRSVMKWRYEVRPGVHQLLFRVATSREEYKAAIRTGSVDFVWAVPPGLPQALNWQDAFGVSHVLVDDQEFQVHVDTATQVITASPPAGFAPRSHCVVEYEVWALMRLDGHVITFEVPRPCRNAWYSLNAGSVPISRVRALDFFSSTRRAAIVYTPSEDHPTGVVVEMKDWLFPKAGVIFVWEAKAPAVARSPRKTSASRTRRTGG
jgi:hypothetical protein